MSSINFRILLIGTLFTISCCCFADTLGRSPLSPLLESELSRLPAKAGVYAKHLESGEEAGAFADLAFDTASVIKIPVMILAFSLAQEGTLDLDQRYQIGRADLEPGSGNLQYHDLGATPTFRDLITEMIINSDNTATRIVVTKIGGVDHINSWLQRNGYEITRAGPMEKGWQPIVALIDPAFEDITVEEAHGLIYSANGDNLFKLYEPLYHGQREEWLKKATVEAMAAAYAAYDDRPDLWYGVSTPREIGQLLEGIVRNELVSKDSGEQIQAIMRRQRLGTHRIPRFLNVPVAHKTGDGPPTVANDVGIVYARSGPIVIAFFSAKNSGPYADLEDSIGKIARLIVEYFDGRYAKSPQ